MKSATILVIVGVLVVGLAIGRAQDEARPVVSGNAVPAGASLVVDDSISRKPRLKVKIESITLKSARAAELATVVEQLFKDDRVAVAAEPSSNSIMVRGQEDIIKQIQELLADLDARARSRKVKQKSGTTVTGAFQSVTRGSAKRTVVETKPSALAGIASQFGRTKVVGAIPGVVQRLPGGNPVIGQAQPMTVRTTIRTSGQYSRWESESQKIAARIRKRPKNQDSNGNDERKLREAIGKAFDARQASRRAEAKKLRDRLDKIEQRIERQQQAKKEIVNTRFNELIHPEYRWNSIGGINSQPAVATPLGLPGPVARPAPAAFPSRAAPPTVRAPIDEPAGLPAPTATSRRNNSKPFQLRPRRAKDDGPSTPTRSEPARPATEPETPAKTPASVRRPRGTDLKDPVATDTPSEDATDPNAKPVKSRRKTAR